MRCRLAMIGLVIVVPLGAATGWWLAQEPRISEAACERIREGMTIAEVVEILGECEPGEVQGEIYGQTYHEKRIWEAPGRAIIVSFANDRVSAKHFETITLWQRLGDWYHSRQRFPGMGVAKRLEAGA